MEEDWEEDWEEVKEAAVEFVELVEFVVFVELVKFVEFVEFVKFPVGVGSEVAGGFIGGRELSELQERSLKARLLVIKR